MELKDWLNSINFNKQDLIKEDPDREKKYPAFIINKCLSGFLDTIMFANEMNLSHQLPNKLQYDFYLNSLRKKKRFSPWIRKEKIDDLNTIKKYYGYSDEKSKEALRILTTDQINFIRSKFETGGKK